MMNTKHFLKTREYLGQVKAASQKVEMLKERIGYYEDAGVPIGELLIELEAAQKELAGKMVEVSDMIAMVPEVGYQWLLTRRYIELLSWDEIARIGNVSHRTVISDHGLALPEMQKALVDAGVIEPEDADVIDVMPHDGAGETASHDFWGHEGENSREV